MFYDGFIYHNKKFGQILIIRSGNVKDFETLNISIDMQQIEYNLNKNVQENINKKFLQETTPYR